MVAALREVASRHAGKIVEVRGRGFLCGVRLADEVGAGDLVAALRDLKLLTAPAAENTVRFLPPLTISEEEIGLAVSRFEEGLATCGAAGDDN